MEGFLVTYKIIPKDTVFEARFEVLNLLEELAKKYPILRETDVIVRPGNYKGIILVDFRRIFSKLDEEVIKDIQKNLEETYQKMREERRLRYIQRFIIFDEIVDTDVNSIVSAVHELKGLVRGKWRITLKTRKYPIDKQTLIRKAAEPINYPVDLENPDYVVLIEIMGPLTGITVLRTKSSK